MGMRKLAYHDLAYCLTRLPKPVTELMMKYGPWLVAAGGFIRSCVTGEPVSDLDLFADSTARAEQIAKEFAGDHQIIVTPNTYTVPGRVSMSVQFIHRWTFPAPEKILDSFDFTISCAAFWFGWSGTEASWVSLCDDRFYPDLASHRLYYRRPERNEDTGGSLLRVLKFYQRGYRIPLNSLGEVIARLVGRVRRDRLGGVVEFPDTEPGWGKIITGLLREVDPNVNPERLAHLPAEEETEQTGGGSLEEEVLRAEYETSKIEMRKFMTATAGGIDATASTGCSASRNES